MAKEKAAPHAKGGKIRVRYLENPNAIVVEREAEVIGEDEEGLLSVRLERPENRGMLVLHGLGPLDAKGVGHLPGYLVAAPTKA